MNVCLSTFAAHIGAPDGFPGHRAAGLDPLLLSPLQSPRQRLAGRQVSKLSHAPLLQASQSLSVELGGLGGVAVSPCPTTD